MDRSLIDQYERGGEKLALSIRGLTREDMLAFPVPGTWSIQQVVIHLLDSELVHADRMKRIIAEDNPSLIGYDESKFAAKLFYDEQSVDDAVQIVDINRKNFARVLRKLPDKTYERVGTHNERGELNLGTLLQDSVNHMEHHLKFIHEKRAKMGKEMW